MSKWETLSNVLDVRNTTVFLVWCVWACASAVACHSLQDLHIAISLIKLHKHIVSFTL